MCIRDRVYGVDTINWDNDVYIVEGPFDKMFLSNSIAMAGADIDLTSFSSDANFIYVYDNERRNEHIVRRMEKVINLGHSIVIWPNDLTEKDINDLILSGMSSFDIQKIIKDNTFKGLQAKVKLTEWKRV